MTLDKKEADMNEYFALKMTPGKYLFFTGLIYFIVGMTNIFVYHFTDTDYIQFVWLITLCIPFFVPFVAQWVGVKVFFRKVK